MQGSKVRRIFILSNNCHLLKHLRRNLLYKESLSVDFVFILIIYSIKKHLRLFRKAIWQILMEIQIQLHIWNTIWLTYKMHEFIFWKVFLNWTFFFSLWHKPRKMKSIIILFLAPFREVWTRSLQSPPPKNVKNKAQLNLFTHI